MITTIVQEVEIALKTASDISLDTAYVAHAEINEIKELFPITDIFLSQILTNKFSIPLFYWRKKRRLCVVNEGVILQ